MGSDEKTALTDAVGEDLRRRGHDVAVVGPPAGEDLQWPAVSR